MSSRDDRHVPLQLAGAYFYDTGFLPKNPSYKDTISSGRMCYDLKFKLSYFEVVVQMIANRIAVSFENLNLGHNFCSTCRALGHSLGTLGLNVISSVKLNLTL